MFLDPERPGAASPMIAATIAPARGGDFSQLYNLTVTPFLENDLHLTIALAAGDDVG